MLQVKNTTRVRKILLETLACLLESLYVGVCMLELVC